MAYGKIKLQEGIKRRKIRARESENKRDSELPLRGISVQLSGRTSLLFSQ
jgi:hypothetical protein